jgi:CspA family cold shock protein
MAEGRIKWYSEKKGYGFIETDTENDIFVHSTGIKDHGFFVLEVSRPLMSDVFNLTAFLSKDSKGRV